MTKVWISCFNILIWVYQHTSALIVLSHNDRGVRALIVGGPLYHDVRAHGPQVHEGSVPVQNHADFIHAKFCGDLTKIERKIMFPTSEFY